MSIRLRQIALVANKLAPVIDDLKAVFGLEVCYIDPGVGAFGLENSLLPVGNNFIEVVAPIKEGTAGGRYLKRRGGDGGYMVICQCDTHDDAARASQARARDEHPNRVGAREQRLPRDAVASGRHWRLVLRNRLGREAGSRRPLGAGRRKRMAQGETHRSRQRILRGRAAIARSRRPGRAMEQNRRRAGSQGRARPPRDAARQRERQIRRSDRRVAARACRESTWSLRIARA